ncbi:MFS general substrate transporter [Dacryopinax primogenitus]|uniref:MFS general substrate transporter n=1 Tax=Dacryopinax primogenitus (strain DJM 731) TaxID=1858805 RepID=M5GDF7_DACPD|nr:MFS general substrate transporter [Dacryopinax primogenitus]EJU02353.1 MFS general substrate transporter [Dacryopinax primogenitus]
MTSVQPKPTSISSAEVDVDYEKASPVSEAFKGADASDAGSNIGLELYHATAIQGLEYTKEEERKVVRKIDFYVLSILSVTFCLQYLDKTALNYANLFGMQTSLNLTSDQFSWLGSIFYFAYLVGSNPSSMLLQRFHMGRILGVAAIIWGVIIMTTAATDNFGGAMANRFFLGLVESIVTPGLVLQTGMWYRLEEQPGRQLWWYSFQGWAAVIGGLLGYGVGHINGALSEWTYIFLILGGVTILWGGLVFFCLPDTLVKTRFFTEREKAIALDRVAKNKSGLKNKTFKWYQVEHALKDPKTYLLFFMSIAAQIPNGTITNFSTVITKGIGNFTTLQTTLLGIPPNVIQVAALLISGYLASKIPNTRVLIMTAGNIACVVAAACMAYLPVEDRWPRLVAFWITPSQSIGFSLSLVMVSANTGGFTKKSFTAATTFVGYCIGNIIGPHFYKPEESPIFRTAIISMLAGYCIKTALGIVLGLYMWNENRRRDRLLAETGGQSEKESEEDGMLDRTEFENPGFRYSL